jgi:DNA primase
LPAQNSAPVLRPGAIKEEANQNEAEYTISMTTRIPQQFIEELLHRTDIVEVIGKRVPLKKSGRELAACCPFHNEKSPSFTVSPKKQFYYCFGCGASGNAVGFLMAHEHLPFTEAVEVLAAQAGLTLPVSEASDQRARPEANLYDLMGEVAHFYQQELKKSPHAVTYLKQRGLTGEVCKKFGVGYAPGGWDNLLKKFPHQKAALLQTGMLINKENEDRAYDRFRDRIMFPIRDKRGRVIAFGGRIIGEGQPKYLNSPETVLFHKGSEAYGLYEVLQQNTHISRLLVVEGYMDVIALSQFGIDYAVATLGTAFTQQSLSKLFNIVPEIVLCFDGDRAGRSAALRAIENSLPILSEGRQLKLLFLPDGEDPDTLIRQEGEKKFTARVAQSINLSSMLIEHLLNQVNLSSVDGRARLVELARPYVNKLQSDVYATLFLQELARYARIDEPRLRRMLQGNTDTEKPVRNKNGGQLNLSQRAMSMLLQQPSLIRYVKGPRDFLALNDPYCALLVSVASCLKEHGELSMGQVLSLWTNEQEAKVLAQLAAVPSMLSEEETEEEFKGIISQLDKQLREASMSALLAKARTLGLAGLTAQERDSIRLFLTESEDNLKNN